MTIYPLAALRALALAAQKLNTPNGQEPPPSRDTVYETVNTLGGVQIDTLQKVARAQSLALWSRLGAAYPPGLLEDLAGSPADRRLFEGWFHAACYLPLSEYRYQLPRHRKTRENGHAWYASWSREPENRALSEAVLQRIQAEGGLKVKDFENPARPRGSWWDWKPAKIALEYLYAGGKLEISRRENFQRVYDLPERVLPPGLDLSEPTPEERDTFWVLRGAKAMGVGLPRNPGDYSWMPVTRSRTLVRRLLQSGDLLEIEGQTMRGVETLVLHRDFLPLLQRAAAGDLPARRTTFLNPWDSFWWSQQRDEALWGFEHLIEAYVPAPKRKFGYYLMPILHGDQLIGRLDPKLERASGLLRLESLHLEPGVQPDEELLAALGAALRDFMAFHRAVDLQIVRSDPPEWAALLLKAVAAVPGFSS